MGRLSDHETVTGTFTIHYDISNDITSVTFEWAFGREEPYDEWVVAGQDEDLDGVYEFDTSFTGKNWITIRGTALADNEEVIVSSLTVNIDNLAPDVSVQPTNDSILIFLQKKSR